MIALVLLLVLFAGKAWSEEIIVGDWSTGITTQGVLMVDEKALTAMAKEASESGGLLMVAPYFYDKTTETWHRIDYLCYQRMKDAIKSAYSHIEHQENGQHIAPGVIMSEAKWKKFQKTEKECAQ